MSNLLGYSTQQTDDEVSLVSALPSTQTILDLVIDVTGMSVAVISRVTAQRWTACAVRDDVGFGLLPGTSLALGQTLCHDVMQGGDPVCFHNASEDSHYSTHAVPRIRELCRRANHPR